MPEDMEYYLYQLRSAGSLFLTQREAQDWTFKEPVYWYYITADIAVPTEFLL